MSDFDFGVGHSGKLPAFLSVTLAVFMLALGVGILGSPMNMAPILGYLLKTFITLVFGGISALCIVYAVRAMRRDPELPVEVSARCLTCGELTPHDLVCPVCDELPQNRTTAFRVQSDDLLGQVFGALILTGVGCLGVFIMIGPILDGERRWWALIAFFALGLLMFVVGAAGFVGFSLALWDRALGDKVISFSCHGPERFTEGTGKIAWGKLVNLKGTGQITAPLVNRGRPEGGYRASLGDLDWAEAMATFDAAGFIEMVDTTRHSWCLGDPSGKTRSLPLDFKRTTQRRTIVTLCKTVLSYGEDEDDTSDTPRPDLRDHRDAVIGRYLARYLYEPQALRDFKKRLDADPLHRTQLELHARVLRDRGVVVSNALVEAVVEALLRENAA